MVLDFIFSLSRHPGRVEQVLELVHGERNPFPVGLGFHLFVDQVDPVPADESKVERKFILNSAGIAYCNTGCT